jgi:KUP system potassium uptake protein
LTIVFGHSDRLAGAYGAAVSTTMLMTTAILYRIMRVRWRWPRWAAVAIFAGFITVDFVFFSANLLKIAEGGWIPLLVGAAIYLVMTTWRSGIDAMHRRQERDAVTIAQFVRRLRDKSVLRVPGKAIFLTRLRGFIPSLITDHVRQMGSLYEEAIALTVEFSAVRPRVRSGSRLLVERLGPGFWHVTVRFGFVEVPDLARTLGQEKSKCPIAPEHAIYFSERDYVVARKQKPRLARWRRRLFSLLYRNAVQPSDRFNIPAEDFVQISREIEV